MNSILEKVYYGNTLENWALSLLIILIGFVLTKCVILLNKHVIKKFTTRSKSHLDDILFGSMEKPILLGIMLIAIWIATSRLNLGVKTHELISKSYQLLIVLNITWLIARLVGALIEEFACNRNDPNNVNKIQFNNRLIPLIKRGTLILIWIIGLVMALNNVGVQVATLLGTLGIGGIAFALAAQDTIKNIFGGITIFVDHPFRIGDKIRYETIEGTVEDIGLRSTRIRLYNKQLVTVPNYQITDASVTNISAEPGRRVVLKLGLTYNTDYKKMQQAVTILKSLPKDIHEITDEDMTAIFSDFADSALVITFTYFIKKQSNILLTISKVNFEILRKFNDAALDFAFPTQTIYLEKNDEVENKPENKAN
jgi:MscS family membrane protein